MLLSSVLRAKSLLQLLAGKTKFYDVYQNYFLKDEHWPLIAEFHGIMNHTNHLAKFSQTEEPGEIAFSWFEVSCCRELLSNKEQTFKVVDVTWSWAPNTLFNDIKTAHLPYEELDPISRKLVDRLIDEIDKYFPTLDSDQLIAMKLHPVMQTIGMQ